MDESYKEVDFHKYCKTCKFEKCDETDVLAPCWDCLNEPVNVYSHKPVHYEQAERGHVEPKAKREEKEK